MWIVAGHEEPFTTRVTYSIRGGWAVLLVGQIMVYRMRGGDSAACNDGEGSCDMGDGCELHSRIQRPALNAGVSGRYNTPLYSSGATLSYRHPASKTL